jgi:uncharacterized protein YbjT (DUF2867 family)
MPDSKKTKNILVLGGTGFIGRHAVSSLRLQEAAVIIGTRQPATQDERFQYRQFHFEKMTTPENWFDLLDGIDVVLNCVGILRAKGAATYDRVHHLAPYALSRACAVRDIRFVHVSALGLHENARSGFLTSKKSGELAIQSGSTSWIIVRPSLLDGEGGYGAAWLRGIARLPLFVVPRDALGHIAALDVTDLGQALASLCLRTDEYLKLHESRFFELGGTQSYVFESYIRGLRRRHTEQPAWCLRIPGLLSRLGAHLCDAFNVTPFSFGHWELLTNDNVPHPNRLPELLGREPTAVIASLQIDDLLSADVD